MKEYSQKLLDIVEIRKVKKSISNYFRNKDLKRLLFLETSFLNYDAVVSDRLYYVEHNLYKQATCPICDKPTKIKNNKIIACSKKCDYKIIDPKSGLEKGILIGLKIKDKNSQINSETGLTGYETSGKKTKEKMLKIDSETGLNGYETKGLKTKETMSKINSETGLSINQMNGIKIKSSMSKVDSETGLTGYERARITSKRTKSKINSETGLNGYETSGKKTKEKMSKTDSETGLTGYETNGLKTKETMSKINSETGLTGYETNAKKIKETNSKINSETGLNGYETGTLKTKEIMSKINSETGLNGYETGGKKTKEKMLKIDSETGLNGYETSGKKIKETNSKINSETGLSIYQSNSLKSVITVQTNWFNNKLIPSIVANYTMLTTSDDYIANIGSTNVKYSCNKCGTIRESSYNYIRCTKCYPYNKSIAEHEVLEYCQTLSSDVESNIRQIIKPLELDIYLPNHNLAIEYDGLYYHSSDSIEAENKNYHLNKTNLCQEKGIQLFHIFENEWLDSIKQKIWKSIIKNRLGKSSRIYARKTTVVQITSKDKSQFLIDNHLQGDCASSVNLGLYLGDELVSVMTFGRSRYDKKIDWELLRFCNRLENSVVGGASKLLKAFRRENVGSIISYADKRRSRGGLYKALGFTLSHKSEPNYFYFGNNSMKLESRIKYQKHKLEKVLDKFDSELTESENMYANGYRKVYDCGNQVWVLSKI